MLERDFQSKLDQPRIAGGSDLSELRAGGIAHRVVELGVVEYVEEVNAEEGVHALTNLGGLLEGHVEIGDAGAAANCARSVAVGAKQRLAREVVDGSLVDGERVGVEVVVVIALRRKGLKGQHLVRLPSRFEEEAGVQLVVLPARGNADGKAGLQ